MQYKIQMLSTRGWADLKSSEDGVDYKVIAYESINEATDELKSMELDLDEFEGRAVPVSVPQDEDLYT